MRFYIPAVRDVGNIPAADFCSDGENELIVIVYTIITISFSTILIAMFTRTLVHAVRGSKYKFIIRSVIAMILSNVGTIMIVVAEYELLVGGNASLGICWMLGLGYLLQNSTFNIVIYLLADKYKFVATKIPYFLKKMPLPKTNHSWEMFKESIFLTMNLLFPVIALAFSISFFREACATNSTTMK